MAGTALAEDERKRKIMKTSEGTSPYLQRNENIGKELVPRPSQLPPTIQLSPHIFPSLLEFGREYQLMFSKFHKKV